MIKVGQIRLKESLGFTLRTTDLPFSVLATEPPAEPTLALAGLWWERQG
jgi:hypothetical protein